MKRGRKNQGGNATKRSRYIDLNRMPTEPRVTQVRGGNYTTVARTRGAITKEMNYFENALTFISMQATTAWGVGNLLDGDNLCLFYPTQGAGVTNRIGKKVAVMRIRIKGILYQQGGSDIVTPNNPGKQFPQQLVRLILFCDKQTNTAQVDPNVLMAPAQSADRGAVITCFQNIDNIGRFQVYKDKTMAMPQPALAAVYNGANVLGYQQGVSKAFKLNHTFTTPLIVNFNNNNGGDVADIVDNSFHLIGQCTSSDLAATDMLAPKITYVCRTYFKEI